MNLKASFEKIEFEQSFSPNILGIETSIIVDSFGLIAGAKLMRLNSTSFLALLLD
ncbi:hypothetical protein JCM19314_2514 [Nonlabens ulvanivorans]|uniref:Uncharacterized protein n=1 Tax=Nonlabens ulvanivorans TaxID=906888 RepID=A0A090Q9T4_NONUL|nr:hypothetical protein [Nonlabens ulvanivorans]GAK98483.1 hypothetical protein JCM19314_2514 [Nonlabens ulvanivorans]